MGKRQKWSAYQREAWSLMAKRQWAETPAAVREEWMQKGRAAYAAKYPERVTFIRAVRAEIEAGHLVPGPCQDCGGSDAQPEFDYGRLELTGWSHYDCRKARRS